MSYVVIGMENFFIYDLLIIIDYFFVIFVNFVVNSLIEKTKPILGKGKSKKVKGKMRVNPEFLRWAI